MSEDQQRWDRRHGATRIGDLTEPDGFILRALDGLGDLQGLDVLDLACGAGRHALELARRRPRVRRGRLRAHAARDAGQRDVRF